MSKTSRGLRETVVRALAKVGLVWAVAVLGALFMTMSAHGSSLTLPAGTTPGQRAMHACRSPPS